MNFETGDVVKFKDHLGNLSTYTGEIIEASSSRPKVKWDLRNESMAKFSIQNTKIELLIKVEQKEKKIMKLKLGDMVRLKKDAVWSYGFSLGTPKNEWKLLEDGGPYEVIKFKPGSSGDFINISPNPTGRAPAWNFFARFFEKVVDEIKVGDYVTLKKPSEKWTKENGKYGLPLSIWNNTGTYKVDREHTYAVYSSNEKIKRFYVNINTGIEWYFPVATLTKVEAPKEKKEKKPMIKKTPKNKFKVGDFVRLGGINIKWTGKIVERKSIKDKRCNYKVQWSNTVPVKMSRGGYAWHSAESFTKMTDKEITEMNKPKKLKNKFKVGDVVKLKSNPKYTGKIIKRHSIKDRPRGNYTVKWNKTVPHNAGGKTQAFLAKWLVKLTASEINTLRKAAAKANKPKKNKFKVGDPVRLKTKSATDWVGCVIERVNKAARIGNYKVRWNKTSPGKCGDTWHSVSGLVKLTVDEMREIAKNNKLSDFKPGQRVTVVFNSRSVGSQQTVKLVTNNIKTNIESISGWNSPASLYIHENTSVTVTDTAEENVSLKRKKEKKMNKVTPKTSRFGKKKAAKKVAKKATKQTDGYVVRALIANGAASKSSIQVGDTIVNVDGHKVNRRRALGGILKRFKKGAVVSVTVKKPDGREVYLRKVKLGSRKDGRATLGVISGKKAAAAYNLKNESKAKTMAKSVKAIAEKAVAEVPENEFMARARIEMEGAAALMADMKGRDALLKARNLRAELKTELRKGMKKNTNLVNNYLERLRGESTSDVAETEGYTLSTKGKVVFGLIGLVGALSGVAFAINFFGLL